MNMLRENWPEYFMEAWGLAVIMLVSAAVTVVAERALPAAWSAFPRRMVEAIVIAGTVVTLIYSPWGRRSGAHFNPAVTLTFLVLGKVKRWDAAFYTAFQVAGGIVGIFAAGLILGPLVRDPPVTWIVTQPGAQGTAVAFVAEFAISFLLMNAVLVTGGRAATERFTGIIVGLLIVFYICFEAPLSGFSMNPARSFASAAASKSWHGFWVYLVAPPAGMLAAAYFILSIKDAPRMGCAKLIHDRASRCIHCGFIPEQGRHVGQL